MVKGRPWPPLLHLHPAYQQRGILGSNRSRIIYTNNDTSFPAAASYYMTLHIPLHAFLKIEMRHALKYSVTNDFITLILVALLFSHHLMINLLLSPAIVNCRLHCSRFRSAFGFSHTAKNCGKNYTQKQRDILPLHCFSLIEIYRSYSQRLCLAFTREL